MATLHFKGVVRRGLGKFSEELVLPSRSALSKDIRDWPETPKQGTLNVRVIGGFPAEFVRKFGAANVGLLDLRTFCPEVELGWLEIGGNTLPPTALQKDRGNAQVWRATLRNSNTGAEALCWVLRRIGSTLTVDLELVSGEPPLRERLELPDGALVEVILEGEWTD